MTTNFVLTLTGSDRIGIVDELTGLLLERGGNVETSRMARLAGEFAILMLVSLPEDQLSRLDANLSELSSRGYKITTTVAKRSYTESTSSWLPYRIEVQGADHEGIIHEVAHYLSGLGISIETMESETSAGPTSGVPLFGMNAQIVVPPALSVERWQLELELIGRRMNVDIRVSAG
jgi:glycine cleavage system transcriptional repressor